jgi:hypothetical protein
MLLFEYIRSIIKVGAVVVSRGKLREREQMLSEKNEREKREEIERKCARGGEGKVRVYLRVEK